MIRVEEEKDWATVHALNASVFETTAEANLVDAIRQNIKPVISLVAEDDEKIVGHIMFSPVSLSGHPHLKIMGLGPMCVASDHQRKGIGTALVQTGIEQCKQLGFGAVVVLGHPEYYPRFGFLPSSGFGVECEFEVPEDVFMIRELIPGYLRDKSGTIKYHAVFNQV